MSVGVKVSYGQLTPYHHIFGGISGRAFLMGENVAYGSESLFSGLLKHTNKHLEREYNWFQKGIRY